MIVDMFRLNKKHYALKDYWSHQISQYLTLWTFLGVQLPRYLCQRICWLEGDSL